MAPPVTAHRIKIAEDFGLVNVDAAARACRKAGLAFFDACALIEKESPDPSKKIKGGANIYGHDVGGVNTLSGNRSLEVTDVNFMAFLVKVMNGARSNGVGPLQITYAGELRNAHRDGGYFRQMSELGLRPWVPEENMLFGFRTFVTLINAHGLEEGAARYNGGGSPNADARAYGKDIVAKSAAWRRRFVGH